MIGYTSQDKLLKVVAKENEACQSLTKVPGIDIMTATILLTIAGVASNFKNGREFAAFLGLVPRQNSTGGKARLLGISKRGDGHTRTLLIHGTRAALCRMISGYTLEYRRNLWAVELAARRGKNKASVALAIKNGPLGVVLVDPRRGIQACGVIPRLSCRLQRDFFVCEPLASGPPSTDIETYPRLPRKKRWKKVGPAFGEPVLDTGEKRRGSVEDRKRVYTHQGAANKG